MAEGTDSWTAWFGRHGGALVLFARQWTTSRFDAEDLVQEAFLRFWRSRSIAADPVAYLYACVRNCALERARCHGRRSRREETVARAEGAMFTSPVEMEERRLLIEEALAALPLEQREVVVLKIWGTLSMPQIAMALEIPVNTAASRYRYALARLRTQLAEEVMP